MKPPRYTGAPIGGGERVEGYYLLYKPFDGVEKQHVIFSPNKPCFTEVQPATVEPVRLPVKHERTLVGDYRCPACNAAFIEGPGRTPFCGNCGAALEWPEDKEG